MSLNPKRYRALQDVSYTGGVVVYHMCRDIRAADNDALLYAQELAHKHNTHVVVVYTIWNYLWEGATRRFYDWVLPSLQEVEHTLRAHNIPLVIAFQEKHKQPKLPQEIGCLVIDHLPLRFMRKWKDAILHAYTTIPIYEVDAHACIPAWELSPKQEFAARTIRGKVHAQLPLYMDSYSKLATQTCDMKAYPPIAWNDISNKIVCYEHVSGTGDFVPGEKAARATLHTFLTTKLTEYETARNDFTKDGQSNLSPYISHGNISIRRIVLELLAHTKAPLATLIDEKKNGSNGTLGSSASFVEECVVRSLLSENFCYYQENYDSAKGFPSWAKETLRKASTDARQYVYTRKEFEESRTHDEIWNAAQRQMVIGGKMHGYLRMYWAKKILEWTTSPEDAMRIAVYLNDTYELDGRDPNGYVGCAWSIGGVHDRPWFARPIFGTVRYMAESGVKKRGSIETYIALWKPSTP